MLAIKVAEAQERYAKAVRTKLESSILTQWYYSLAEALAEQERRKLDEPDFSSHWIICPDGLLRHLSENGVEVSTESWHEPVINFIDQLIGDQLREYGVEIRMIGVTSGLGGAHRFYILKPDQEPSYY